MSSFLISSLMGALALAIAPARAQPKVEWSCTIPGMNLYEDNYDLTIDPYGNAFVAGQCYDGGICTTKVAVDGQLAWQSKFQGESPSRLDRGESVVADSLGNSYTVGSNSEVGLIVMTTLKYSPDGEQLWRSQYNRTGSAYGKKIDFDPRGDIIVMGPSNGGSVNDQSDWSTLKYSAENGMEMWASIYTSGPGSNDWPTDLAVDSNGSAIIVGDQDTSWTIQKLNADGAQLWSLIESDSTVDTEIPQKVVSDDAGNIYVAGSVGNGTSVHGDRYGVGKYSSEGTQLWLKVGGGELPKTDGGSIRVYGLALDKADGLYVVGWYDLEKRTKAWWVAYFDSNGTQMWNRCPFNVTNSGETCPSGYHESCGYSISVPAIGVGPDGNAYIAASLCEDGKNQLALVTVSALGQILDRIIYPANVRAKDLALDKQGNAYISGLATGSYVVVVKYSTVPPDSDGDGIPDDDDRCPYTDPGVLDFNGDGCIGPVENVADELIVVIEEQLIPSLVDALESLDANQPAARNVNDALDKVKVALENLNGGNMAKAVMILSRAIKDLDKAEKNGFSGAGEIIDKIVDVAKTLAQNMINLAIAIGGIRRLSKLDAAQTWYKRGLKNMEAGKFKKAVKNFSKAVKILKKELGL